MHTPHYRMVQVPNSPQQRAAYDSGMYAALQADIITTGIYNSLYLQRFRSRSRRWREVVTQYVADDPRFLTHAEDWFGTRDVEAYRVLSCAVVLYKLRAVHPAVCCRTECLWRFMWENVTKRYSRLEAEPVFDVWYVICPLLYPCCYQVACRGVLSTRTGAGHRGEFIRLRGGGGGGSQAVLHRSRNMKDLSKTAQQRR